MDILVILIPLLPLMGFLATGLGGTKISAALASWVACGTVFVSFLLSGYVFLHMGQGDNPTSYIVPVFDWIQAGKISVDIGFLVDPLSVLMMLIITGIGFLIHLYSVGYMHGDEGYVRFFAFLNLFVFFMLLLVMGSNYLVMFIGWEGVGLCSYLLIGFWFKNQEYNVAANKAFIMNRIGDLGMLIGMALLIVHTGSLSYGQVFSQASGIQPSILTLITVLLFVGAMGKSAQIPLYTWLPDAMAGPTPVSALIHAATMVTAGIYMVARNHTLYLLAPFSMDLMVWIGAATALFAATIAIAQQDIKKVLAYSTVSQLGLMFVALGTGAFTSGIFHMMTHAFFKALLFLGAGSVIHALSGEQDLRNMGGLKKYLPITGLTFLTGVLAISGIPPFSGFFSKDAILSSAFSYSPILWAMAVLVSLLTTAYMFRLFFLAFHGEERAKGAHAHESPWVMTLPLVVLAVLSSIGGFLNIPELFGGTPSLENFLAPVFASGMEVKGHGSSHATEFVLMGILLVFILGVIGALYFRYVQRKHVPSSQGAMGWRGLVQNKYYVDELYGSLVVKPVFRFGAFLGSVVEKSGIDRFVDLLGTGVLRISSLMRLLQDGRTGFYLFMMVIGAIAFLWWGLK